MPRRRPGALRAVNPVPPVWGPWTPRIPGLSEHACAAIQRAERAHDDSWAGLRDGLWDGSVEAALRHYQAFLHQPGRYLELTYAVSPHPGGSLVDVANARDVLEEAMRSLPQPSRAELGRLVARLDGEFRRRTLPDPLAHRCVWWSGAWWHRRLYDGEVRW